MATRGALGDDGVADEMEIGEEVSGRVGGNTISLTEGARRRPWNPLIPAAREVKTKTKDSIQ